MTLRLKLFGLCLALLSSFLFAAPAAAADPPNIVFVLVDDLDVPVWDAALANGLLPNIQAQLIDKGTTFKQMFVSQSLCCPSRATLFTGQYPQNHGVTLNHDVYENFQRDKEPTALATWVNPEGKETGKYRTGYFGKYLNESGHDARHVPAGWETWRALVPTRDTSVVCMYGYALADSGRRAQTFGSRYTEDPAFYQTDVLAQLAAGFIGSSDPRPFLLMVAPMAPHAEDCGNDVTLTKRVRTSKKYEAIPHTPVGLPVLGSDSYNEATVTDKPRWIQNIALVGPGADNKRKAYFNDKIAALRPVDDLVGTLIAALGDKMSNTVFIFTSDNGFQYGTHRVVTKEDFYEESIRVPMVVRGPGQTTKRTQQSWVLNNDWAPTIAAYAGVMEYGNVTPPRPAVDGRSFKSLVEDENATNGRNTFMIRAGDPDGTTPLTAIDHVPFRAVRTRNTALTSDPSGIKVIVYAETYDKKVTVPLGYERELYDLDSDLIQEKSMHADDGRKRQMVKLRERLTLLKNCKGNAGDLNDCRWLEDN